SNPVSTSRVLELNGLKFAPVGAVGREAKMSALASFSVPSGCGTWSFLVDLDSSAPVVVAATLTDIDDMLSRLTPPELERGTKASKDPGGLASVIRAYFAGDLKEIDGISVVQPGGPFKQRVWVGMRKVKPGKPESYAQLAARAKNPKAVRAAGSACATNRIPLIVPCHRIVRTGGALGNYYYGSDIKAWLLDHEAKHA
ncbi:MAG: methylated-DNA--[protein]-cysteine S-methyltransferase, partial [Actinomycetes bacterium]